MARIALRSTPNSVYVNGTDGAAPNALSCANSSSLNPTAAVTIEAWFKPMGMPKAFVLFDNSQAGATNSYFLLVNANSSSSWFSTISGTGRNVSNANSRPVRWNGWNFFQATYTGSAIRIFLNGSQFTEEITGISGSLGTNTGILRIGAYYTGGSSLTFRGLVYRPRIYNVGCTLAEHQDRYYREITSTALSAGLVLDPDFTAGSGSTITDLSGSGNTITINASASWNSVDRPFLARTTASSRTLAAARTLASSRTLA